MSPAAWQSFMRLECSCISGCSLLSTALFFAADSATGSTSVRSATVVMTMPSHHGALAAALSASIMFCTSPTGVDSEPRPRPRSSPMCGTPAATVAAKSTTVESAEWRAESAELRAESAGIGAVAAVRSAASLAGRRVARDSDRRALRGTDSSRSMARVK
jgi:hypothetical protein